VKKPRAWLDHEKFGICRSMSHCFQSAVEDVTQPAQIGFEHLGEGEVVGQRRRRWSCRVLSA
jgi:hypothetical protein